MSLYDKKSPSLKDKLVAQEEALKAEADAVEVELKGVKKAKKRAGKA
jgi:hypothetical protein